MQESCRFMQILTFSLLIKMYGAFKGDLSKKRVEVRRLFRT